MPRNTKGGNKAKRGKNCAPKEFITIAEHDENQHYGKITKVLGSCRFEVLSLKDNKTRLGHIRGNLRKRAWMNNNDTVIIALRTFEDNKCDIIHVYSTDETQVLITSGEIPKEYTNKSPQGEDDECAFTFDDI